MHTFAEVCKPGKGKGRKSHGESQEAPESPGGQGDQGDGSFIAREGNLSSVRKVDLSLKGP